MLAIRPYVDSKLELSVGTGVGGKLRVICW
jgi:hypothetical protein